MSINIHQFLNSPISDAIDRNPVTVTSDISIAEAIGRISQPIVKNIQNQSPTQEHLNLLSAPRASCLLVVQNHQLIGILTERDIVRLIAQGIQIDGVKINDVMTRNLITIAASEVQNIFTIVNYFQQHQIRHLPVLSEIGKLVGLITLESLRSCLKSVDLLKLRQVQEVMSADVIHGSPDIPIVTLAKRMANYRVSCVVIVHTNKQQKLHPVGIVTERDIVQFQAMGLNIHQVKASEIMSTPIKSLKPSDDLWTAHQQMQKLRVGRLVVCGNDGELLGIVTQTSLLQSLNPVDMYGVIQVLQQEVYRLQTEQIELLNRNNSYLEQRVQKELSDRQQIEAHLKREQDFNAVILDTISSIVIVLDRQGRIVRCNHAGKATIGYSFAELQGKYFWEFLLMPEEVESVQGVFRQLQTGQFPNQHQNYCLTKTGQQRLIAWSNTVILDAQGNVEYVIATGEDITERRQTELALAAREASYQKLAAELEQRVQERTQELEETIAKLAESEERFRTVADFTYHWEYWLGNDGNFIYISPSCQRITGYSAQAFFDDPGLLERIIYPGDRDNFFSHECGSGETPDSQEIDFRIVTASGEIRWIAHLCRMLYFSDGICVGIRVTNRDITDSKLLQNQLIESQASLAESQRIAHIGSWSLNLLTQQISWSKEKFCIYGRNPEIGEPTYPELLAMIHPDDRVLFNQNIDRAITEGNSCELEFRIFRSDGSMRYIFAKTEVFQNQQGEVVELFGICQDITERKQVEITLRESEEKFRQIAETIQGVFYIQTLDCSQVLYVSPAWEKIWGLSCDVLYQNPLAWLEAVHPEDRQEVIHPTDFQVQTESKAEYRIIRPDGEIRWISSRSFPVRNEVGEIYRVVGFAEDITEKKHTILELTESRRFIQKIADTTPQMLYIYEPITQRNTYVNQAIGDILGYSDREIQEMGAGVLARLLHPDDIAIVIEHYQKMELATDGDVLEIEYRMQHANGSWCWLMSRDTVFSRSPTGRPEQILGTATDITARKQSEQALQMAYQSLEQTNQRLEKSVRELEQRNHEMAIMSQTIKFLQACEQIEDTYELLAEFLKQLFPDCSGSVSLSHQRDHIIKSVSSFGNLTDSETVVELNDCWALRRTQVHLASDAQPGLFCPHVHQEPQPTATLCIPLLAHSQIWGLFYLRTQLPEGISSSQQQLADNVAEQISLALYNLKLREQLKNDSIRDSLTGLFNRRYLDESLDREIRKAQRNQQPLSIIMVDVDHFKRFNDTYGHDVGDIVLRELARFLQQQVRESDIACRYGGEEMTLILINTPLEIAKQRAEQICSGVRALSLQHQGKSLPALTVSLGVACFPLHGATGEEVVQRADAALYQAKKTGRNRVVLYQLDLDY